jgi:hypothetical protein
MSKLRLPLTIALIALMLVNLLPTLPLAASLQTPTVGSLPPAVAASASPLSDDPPAPPEWRSLNPTRDGTLTLPAPYLYGVQMLSANYGWAVGGTCDFYASPPPANCPGSGFALFWDGARWRQALVPVSAGTLTSVFIVSSNNVWAVGMADSVTGNATIIHWDGTSWAAASVPADSPTDLFSAVGKVLSGV